MMAVTQRETQLVTKCTPGRNICDNICVVAKNTDYSKKLFRFVRILNKLETAGKVSTRELADDFNVNIRTAQRSIELLNQAGYPLFSTSKGTYSFMPGFSLKQLPLSSEEASLLTFLCEVTQSMGGTFAKSFKSLSSKAVLGMNGPSPFHAIATVAAKKDYPAMGDVQAAVEECREIEILYANGKTHRLRPLKIIYSDGFWYLIATIEGKSEFRTFRLDRIKSVEPLGETFNPPKNFMRKLDQSTSIWSGSNTKHDIKVLLSVDADVAEYFESAAYFPHQKKLKARRDGSLLIETRIRHFMEVIPVIQRWIPHIVVVKPKALRDEIRQAVRDYARSA
jgi:predicted DNA-binding transcriptional regulator YafY